MNARRLVTWLVLVLAPLALGLSALGATRAAPRHDMAAMSHMSGCPDQGAPQPAKAPACGVDCPLICTPVSPGRSTIEARIRNYARLRYDLALDGLEGRALEPELPPPRAAHA
jgi:hypothetical protein